MLEGIGHYGHKILIAAIVVTIVNNLSPFSHTLGSAFLGLGCLGLMIYSWFAIRAHSGRLCEMCVSSFPLSAPASADQKRMRFWLAHRDIKWYVGYLVILLVVGLTSDFYPFGRYIWAALLACMIYIVLADDTHRKLQPWCPWCGKGGEERVETPENTPVGTYA